jgi:hypothetical protein
MGPPAGDLGQTNLAMEVKGGSVGVAGKGDMAGANPELGQLESSPCRNA